jgi:hypothetical protein
MAHTIYESFPIEELDFSTYKQYKLEIKPHIFDYIKYTNKKAEIISFKKIKYKDISLIDLNDLRYIRADINYPGIVLKQSNFYRVLDGRHRIRKCIELGKKSFNFYILKFSEIQSFLTHI